MQVKLTLARTTIGPLIAVALLLSACGGDDDGTGSGTTTADTADAAADGTDSSDRTDSSDGTDSSEGSPGGATFDCPLTAEEVGELLGASLERSEGTCAYAPGGDAGRLPAAGFLEQLPELCTDDYLTAAGYTEPVETLGVDAFLRPHETATAELFVCADAPFVVVVDMGPDSASNAAAAAAETLALMALEAG